MISAAICLRQIVSKESWLIQPLQIKTFRRYSKINCKRFTYQKQDFVRYQLHDCSRADSGPQVCVRLHLMQPRHSTLERKLLLHSTQVLCSSQCSACRRSHRCNAALCHEISPQTTACANKWLLVRGNGSWGMEVHGININFIDTFAHCNFSHAR